MAATVTVTTRSYFSTLTILHIALTTGQVIFGLVGFTVKLISEDKPMPLSPETLHILQYLIPGLALLSIGASQMLFSSRIKALKELSSSAAQYKGYRSACILRYALLEGPSLIALVVFLLSYNYLFLAVPALIVLVFIAIRPTKKALLQHLQPPYDQQMLLEDPDAVLYEEGLPDN